MFDTHIECRVYLTIPGKDQPASGAKQAAPRGKLPVEGNSGAGNEEDAGKAPKSSGELRREIQIQPLMVKVTSGQDMSTIGQRRLVLNQFYVIFKGINLMRVMARGLGTFTHDKL